VIDSGYRGEVRVLMENLAESAAEIHAGDKLVNLIPYPVLTTAVEVVEELGASRRKDGGFGSSGRK
jgi:dUTP pyrophosphatase